MTHDTSIQYHGSPPVPVAIVAFVELEQALVGNLPYSVLADDIGAFFGDCGVTDVYLVKDRDTGDLKVSEHQTRTGIDRV